MDVRNLFYTLTGDYTFSGEHERQQEAWAVLQRSYGSKFRHYHNFEHIRSMLTYLEPVWEELKMAADLQLAVIYHDVAYDPVATHNEEESARLARMALQTLQFPMERVDRIVKHILTTKDHEIGDEIDAAFLVDADLAILGEASPRYDWYKQQIRLEYAMFDEAVYRAGRRRVLQNFIDRKWIYHTANFRDRFEQQARANLKSEIRSL